MRGACARCRLRIRQGATGPWQRLQRGFTLLELSIVLFIGSGFLMAMMLSVHSHMLQLRAQTMAQRYQAVQAAVQRYVQAHRSLLLALPADCSLPAWQAESPRPPSGVVAMGACTVELTVQGRTLKIANGLQPAVEQLQSLGLLDPGVGLTLALDHEARVYSPAFAGQSAALAPPRLAVLLRKHCDTADCGGSSPLETLVYNLQPYVLEGGNWAFDRRDQVNLMFNELGDRAAMSQASDAGRLVGGGERFALDNPVQEASGAGTPGIVALRSLPHSELDDLWARRDGRSTITGDWDFGSRQLKGVSRLGARNLDAQDLQLSGRADLNAATAQSIEVQRLSPQHLRLPTAEPDQTCDPALSNVALDPASGQLLTCHPATLLWRLP